MSLGRREALVSLVAGVSIASASSGSEEVSNTETRQGALVVDNVDSAILNDEVASNSGRPAILYEQFLVASLLAC